VITLSPAHEADVAAAVRAHALVVPHGRLTKAPLVAADAAAVRLDMTGIAGVSEYDPGEFTFTARAGTPVHEIQTLLARNGQYLPFDPPLAEHGATLGGTLAAGLNGPRRLRYGGLRDFVIGVRFVDGTGALVRGGGKVVKNAAGFDLPKLMVGSMGRLGIIVELTFKVFPEPHAFRTLRIHCRDIDDAVSRITTLSGLPLELEALELEPPATLVVRVAGAAAALDAHAERVGRAAGGPYESVPADEEGSYWPALGAFAWVPAPHWLIKVPLTPKRIPALDAALERLGAARRYSVAGNVAWLAWPAVRPLAELDLGGLHGLIVRGPPLEGAAPWLGPPPDTARAFATAVKHALDPERRMPQLL
jgi:glycolate oxidase FAD binding subunit